MGYDFCVSDRFLSLDASACVHELVHRSCWDARCQLRSSRHIVFRQWTFPLRGVRTAYTINAYCIQLRLLNTPFSEQFRTEPDIPWAMNDKSSGTVRVSGNGGAGQYTYLTYSDAGHFVRDPSGSEDLTSQRISDCVGPESGDQVRDRALD